MSINIGPPSVEELRPRISVIGVGGAGGNAVANMIRADIEGVDFIVANTDAQSLNNSVAEHRIQLGPEITQGLGAGSRPEIGRAAAEETVAEIERALDGVNMVFIAAGMGGGTGTGAAPVIAEVARGKGILTVGVVTKPFLFEGTRRMRSADSGIDELQKHVDTLIVIPNQNLFLVAKAETTFKEAFMLADEVLQQGVRSITDLMVMPGLINLDFADIRSVMNEMGKAMMGTGEGEGENRALEAAERAIANPLLDGVSMKGARGVIISIIGGEDMRLLEVDEAANHIRELVDPDANIIWGSAFNPELEGRIRVSVVATGIDALAERQPEAAAMPGLGSSRGPRRPAFVRDAAPVAPALADAGETEPASRPPLADTTSLPENTDPQDDEHLVVTAEDGEPDDVAEEEEALELTEIVTIARAETRDESETDSIEDEPAHPRADAHVRQDELLLDDVPVALERSATIRAAEPSASYQAERAGPRILRGAANEDGDEPPVRPSASGSTLFERMTALSRGAQPRDDDDVRTGLGSLAPREEDEPSAEPTARVPRFLGRQKNQ